MKYSPITLFLGGVGALLFVGLLFRWLVRSSRHPAGQELVVVVLLALLVIDSSLYENQDIVPNGLFHPKVGSLSFRIFDLLVPLALLAHLVARRQVRRAPIQVILWGAFLGWIFISAVQGILGGNAKDYVTYEAKVIIYLGVMVLVSQVPPERWLHSRPLRNVIVGSSVLSAFLLVATEAHQTINLNVPLVPLSGVGVMGTDAATIFAALGVMTLAVGVCSDRHRLRTVLVSLPLLAAPLVAGQRAALIGLGTALLLLAAASVASPFMRHAIKLTGLELGLGVLAAVAVGAAVVVISALGSSHVALPFAHEIQQTFASQGKQLSGDDRLNQWQQAESLISSRPWFGWGLGKTYTYYQPGVYVFVVTDLTHNIALDLLVRSGVVGLALFLIAGIMSIRDSVLATLRQVDSRLVALAAAGVALFIGLVVKGMFESIFEKYRLALLMGGLIGLSISFARERFEAAPEAALPKREGRPLDLVALSGAVQS